MDCSTGAGTAVDGCGDDGSCTCLAAGHACSVGWQCEATGCTEDLPPPICDPATQTAPDWGEKEGQCLPSCLVTGGDQCGEPACPGGFRAVEEPTYDCDVCCVEVPAELEASTTMTVIDISEFINEALSSSMEMVGYEVTHELYNVNYPPGMVTFEWGPLPGVAPWPPGSTDLTGYIWAFRPVGGALTYEADAWDYLLNTTTFKNRAAGDVPDYWIGTMISSLCHASAVCNAEERTNIVFWSSSTPIAQSGELTIQPHNVGVLYVNQTQQFTALARDANGDFVDVTQEVSWSIDPAGFPHAGQDTSPGAVVTIDENGLATAQDSWGRVVVRACYPLGCVPTSP